MKALIDGDIVLFRCAASCEPTKIKPFLEEEFVAIERAKDLISRILTQVEVNDYTLYIGGSTNFRYNVWPLYKANRVAPKPAHYQATRQYLLDNYKCEVTQYIEADDALGIEQCKLGNSSVICSIDKDLLQIPGHHFNFVKGESLYVSEVDGLRTFYKQLITGDGADNIPSYDGKIRNTTPKFIQRLLEPIDTMTHEGSMYDYVANTIYDNYDWPRPEQYETMLRNAKLLYIWKKENDEWTPPLKHGQVLDGMPLLSQFLEQEPVDTHLNMKL